MLTKEKFVKKRVGDCSSVGCSSCTILLGIGRDQPVQNCANIRNAIKVNKQVVNSGTGATETFTARFIYNSTVKPDQIMWLWLVISEEMIKKPGNKVIVQSKVFRARTRVSDNVGVVKTQNKILSNCNSAERIEF